MVADLETPAGFPQSMGQNETTRGPPVLVHASTYEGSIWDTDF